MSGRPGARRRPKPSTARDVFINCPFDADYAAIFNAIVFTVVRSGFRARCALETEDAAVNRLAKIIKIIGECPFGIHDISRTEPSGDPPLPRFNMPLELGLWLGAHHLGRTDQVGKCCIVFDREQYRYQRFISDIGGQDIQWHEGRVPMLISKLANWLRHLPGGTHAGGGQSILREYEAFRIILPRLCQQKNMEPDELQFADFNLMATEYVVRLKEETIAPVAIAPPAA
ncbi:hypothetical protein ABZT49_05540 [Methylobacterium sp. EM32]|uniref:hypothetical protein n=1 Tax=Methylobacterium sp. EM32 TaxID=3163481 RepID=UPI0033B49183